MKCIVIDDEPLAGDLLGAYAARTPSLQLAGVYASPTEAFAKIQAEEIPLVFLDIQMPQISGMELARLLPPRTLVVFTTAYEQYALQGYKVNAIDYLLKPVSYEEFLGAVAKAQERAALLAAAPRSATAAPGAPGETVEQGAPAVGGLSPDATSIIVKADYRLRQIPLADILYIEGLKDYVRIFVAGEERSVITLLSMKSLEHTLPCDRFMRVHRSFIVNLAKITTIERATLAVGAHQIPVSDSYRPALNRYIASRIIAPE